MFTAQGYLKKYKYIVSEYTKYKNKNLSEILTWVSECPVNTSSVKGSLYRRTKEENEHGKNTEDRRSAISQDSSWQYVAGITQNFNTSKIQSLSKTFNAKIPFKT